MQKEQLLNNINTYTPEEVIEFIEKGIITEGDLLNCGIPDKVIDALNNYREPNLHYGELLPETAPQKSTEVYFWGVPGSGKTTAMAAVLNTADVDYWNFTKDTGEYYEPLGMIMKNIFNNQDYAILPPPTFVDKISDISFVLRQDKGKQSFVSFKELSGEILQCFYYKSAGLQFPAKLHHQDTFDSLVRLLNGNNRKIHFFIIDYDRDRDIIDANGLTQNDYLEAAVTFFRDNDIFRKSTDAIYIVVTKSDLMPYEKERRAEYAKEYLNDNYMALITVLQSICMRYSLKFSTILFSLGNVYFRRICELDREPSKHILDTLINTIKPHKRSILDIFLNR